ncbi:MAG: arginine deiminase family protein [Phycisphaerales bacterium]
MTRHLAIVRPPSASMGDCLLTHREREAINLDLARRQHAAYREALTKLGREVVVLEPADDCPDAVFVEDPVVALDEVAVIARPATESRRREIPSLERALRPYRELAHIQAPGTLEGGDVVKIDRTLYVGLSTRTNQEGIDQLRALIAPLGYTVHGVPVTGCLHLKTGASHVGGGRVLVNADWVEVSAFVGCETIPVDPEEPWSANGVLLGTSVIVPAGAPGTNARLRDLGLEVHEVGLSEMQKAEGSATCLSVLLTLR